MLTQAPTRNPKIKEQEAGTTRQHSTSLPITDIMQWFRRSCPRGRTSTRNKTRSRGQHSTTLHTEGGMRWSRRSCPRGRTSTRKAVCRARHSGTLSCTGIMRWPRRSCPRGRTSTRKTTAVKHYWIWPGASPISRWRRCSGSTAPSEGACRGTRSYGNSLLWYVPFSRYIWSSAPIFLFLQEQIKDIIIIASTFSNNK